MFKILVLTPRAKISETGIWTRDHHPEISVNHRLGILSNEISGGDSLFQLPYFSAFSSFSRSKSCEEAGNSPTIMDLREST